MQEKKLMRSTSDRMIAGVAAGLADYFDIDTTLVRLIFVLLLITGSAGFWIYIILWVVMPEAPAVGFTAPEVELPDVEMPSE